MRRAACPALALLLVVLSAALVAAPAHARTVAGVTMPETSKAGDNTMVLNGMALRSKAIFKVYVGGLYLPAKEKDWKQVLAADAPRQMLMQWERSVGKATICNGWNEGLEASTKKPPAELTQSFQMLCTYTDDAREGDRFLYTYLPGKGTEVTINGKVKGVIPGKPFADALFACWIGANPPPGEDFRDALMGAAK
jgi:hypothetical protein